jgi:hypothetical protein
MGIIDRIMMAMMKKTVEKKTDTERTGDDKIFLETYGGKVDFTDKEAITQLVSYVRNIMHLDLDAMTR